MMNGQGEWHRLIKFLCEKRKSKKKRVNKRKIKIIMGGRDYSLFIWRRIAFVREANRYSVFGHSDEW